MTAKLTQNAGGPSLAWPPLLAALRPLLAQESQPVYLVGGAVRDAWLGRVSQDLDFVLPQGAIKLAFAVADALDAPAYVLDRERDAGRVVLAEGQTYLDFTRFRGPDLAADLRDRDFTINSMALPAADPIPANLIDSNRGQADLAAKIIRHIHQRTFSDDPVRTLRAVRLAQTLHFTLAPETETAIVEVAPLLAGSSLERVRDEFIKIIRSDQPDSAVARLQTLSLASLVVPGVAALAGFPHTAAPGADLFDHTVSVLKWLVRIEACLAAGHQPPTQALRQVAERLSPMAGPLQQHGQRQVDGGFDGWTLLRLAALYHDVGKRETAEFDEEGRFHSPHFERAGAALTAVELRRLVLSNQAIVVVKKIVAEQGRPFRLCLSGTPVSRRAVYQYYKTCGAAGVGVALLSVADYLAASQGQPEADSWTQLLNVVTELLGNFFYQRNEVIAPPPLLNGHDLIRELELQPGPEVGRLLRLIEEAQAVGEVQTAADALRFAREQ